LDVCYGYERPSNIMSSSLTSCENRNVLMKTKLHEANECLVSAVLPPNEQQHRRNRLVGRAARRRRRKLKEICSIEQSLLNLQQQQQQQQQQNLNDILSNNATIFNNNAIVVPKTVAIPIDRDRIWPAVFELRNTFASWNEDDEFMLVGQLGYVPGNALHVVCRIEDLQGAQPSSYSYVDITTTNNNENKNSKWNRMLQQHQDQDDNTNMKSPVVIQLYPIVYRNEHLGGKSGGRQFKSRKRKVKILEANDTSQHSLSLIISPTTSTQNINDVQTSLLCNNDPMVIEPFPTIFWLTHPLLRCIVSKLELEGYGIQLEQRLANDKHALQMMELAHTAYGQERYKLLIPNDLLLIQSYHWEAAFSTSRGVAGISNKARKYGTIKCLHAHLAHYLSNHNNIGSQYNIVGRWIWEEIQARYNTT
jgi:hypothetical protein